MIVIHGLPVDTLRERLMLRVQKKVVIMVSAGITVIINGRGCYHSLLLPMLVIEAVVTIKVSQKGTLCILYSGIIKHDAFRWL